MCATEWHACSAWKLEIQTPTTLWHKHLLLWSVREKLPLQIKRACVEVQQQNCQGERRICILQAFRKHSWRKSRWQKLWRLFWVQDSKSLQETIHDVCGGGHLHCQPQGGVAQLQKWVAPGQVDQNNDQSRSRRSREPEAARRRRRSSRRRPWSTRPAPGARQDPGPVRPFFKQKQLRSKALLFVLSNFPFWSSSLPLILDTLECTN